MINVTSFEIERTGKARYASNVSATANMMHKLNCLDIQHQLMLLLLDGKLHMAPLEKIEGGLNDVLDIATGTGNWAIDFGRCSPVYSSIACFFTY